MTTYIIGHKKPDLDSVVAPIALQYLYEQEERFGHQNPQALIADPVNPETEYVFKRFGAEVSPLISAVQITDDDVFVLADHNEPDQRSDRVGEGQIVEIVDHHKPNLNLDRPIFVNIKVWGATSTIAWWLMKISRVAPTQKLAGLMLSAILSDTVGLKSPTTTDTDREAVEELARTARISDVNELTLEIFKAKSNLDALSPTEKATNDYKIFDFGGKKLFINQIETVEQDKVMQDNQVLVGALVDIKEDMAVDYAFLIISDVLQVNSKLLYTNQEEKALALQAFANATEVGDRTLDIGKRISRKKEIAPAFEKALSS